MAKIKFNNKNYNIDESAIAPAMAALEEHLRFMMSGTDSETLAAGLYEPGAIALYQSGDTDGASAMMKASWDELVDSGALTLTDGAVSFGTGVIGTKLPDNLPELNEYGFYYGVGYNMALDGMSLTFVFNDDDSAVLTSGSEVMEIPAGVIIYGNRSIDLSAMDIGVGVVSDDGASITFEDAGMNFVLGEPVTIIGADIVLPTGGVVTSIPDEAFRGVPITGIAIAEGVTSIGNYAFEGCMRLTSIVIPDGVTSIGGGAFESCTALTSIVIPEGVTNVEGYIFAECESLTSVTIPATVTLIKDYAFKNCSNLIRINFTGTANEWRAVMLEGNWDFGVGEFTVYYSTNGVCGDTITWSVDGTVLNISGTGSMYDFEESPWNDYWDYINAVTITDGVTSIGVYAFGNGYKLENIDIPDSVVNIGDSAFEGCNSLQHIVIPSKVVNIGDYAFYGCDKFTNIIIPNGVASIGKRAFGYCTGLTSITFEGTVEQWNAITKVEDWNYNVPATYVKCSDGQVAL